MTGYVTTCSTEWVFISNPSSAEKLPLCTGTLKNVSLNELNPSGLSIEDWREYTGEVLGLFAVVFACLALKKAIF